MKLRHLKVICIIVLIAFTWNFIGVSNLALAIAYSLDASGSIENPLIALSAKTQAFSKALGNIQARLQQGQDQAVALTAASDQLNDLLALQDPVLAKFQEIQTNLPQDSPQEVLDRLSALVKQTQNGFTILLNLSSSLKQIMARGNIVADDLAPLVAAVEILLPSSGANITAASPKLPHRRADIPKRSLSAKPTIEIGRTAPTADDLAATKDIQFTPEITNLASQLGNDPVQMYLYVANNLDYQPYYGSVKGSQGAYWEKAGNDMDQASFLMALFRTAGYPARYVTGTVQIPIDQAMNWTGGKTAQVAVNILEKNGIPLQTITAADGSITAINLTHTWVLLHVHDSLHGHKWVQLDPSFKQFQYVDGIDLKQAMGFDFNSFYNSAISGATVNQAQSYVTNLNSTNIQNNLQAYANNLQTWVNMNLPNATVGDVSGYRQIIPQQVNKQFRDALPFQTFTPQSELSVLPDSQRYQVKYEMTGFSYATSLPELYGKRINVSYVPASQWDQQTIDAAGGIYNVFALMVSMKPLLKVEGEVVAQGQGVTLGSGQTCTTRFLRPLDTTWESWDKWVTTGADYAISLDHMKISSAIDLLKQEGQKYQDLVASLPEGVVTQEVIERALHFTGMGYFAEVDTMSDISAKSNKISWNREPSEGFMSRDLKVWSFFGIPMQVNPGSIGLDVGLNRFIPVSTSGNQDSERDWMITSGSISSACEHAIIEQLYGIAAVSTEKILVLANQQGMPIYNINKDNINQILPTFWLPSNVRQNITDYVNAGYTAIVPQSSIQLNQWSGYGWQVIDPNTGAAGYFIAGGLPWSNEISTGGSGTKTLSDFLLHLWKTLDILECMGWTIAAGGYMTYASLCIEAGVLGAGLGVLGCGITAIAIVAGLYALYSVWASAIIHERRWYAFKKPSSLLC